MLSTTGALLFWFEKFKGSSDAFGGFPEFGVDGFLPGIELVLNQVDDALLGYVPSVDAPLTLGVVESLKGARGSSE